MKRYLLLLLFVSAAHASDRPGGGTQGCSIDDQGLFIASTLKEDVALGIAAALSPKLTVDVDSVQVDLGQVTQFTTSFNVTGKFQLPDGRIFTFQSIDQDTGGPAPISYYGQEVPARRDPDGRPIGTAMRCDPMSNASSGLEVFDSSGKMFATFPFLG